MRSSVGMTPLPAALVRPTRWRLDARVARLVGPGATASVTSVPDLAPRVVRFVHPAGFHIIQASEP